MHLMNEHLDEPGVEPAEGTPGPGIAGDVDADDDEDEPRHPEVRAAVRDAQRARDNDQRDQHLDAALLREQMREV